MEAQRFRFPDFDTQKLKQKFSQNYTKKIDHTKENTTRIHNTFFTSIEDIFIRKKRNRQSSKYPNLAGLLSFTNDPTNVASQPLQKIDKSPNMPEQNNVFTIMSCNYPDQIDPFVHIFKIFENKNLFNKCDIHMIYRPVVSERDCAGCSAMSPTIRDISTEDIKQHDLITDNIKSEITKPERQTYTTANGPTEQPIEAKPSCSARVADDRQDTTEDEMRNKPLKRFKYFTKAHLDNKTQLTNSNKKKLNKLRISPTSKHSIYPTNSTVDDKIKEHNKPVMMTDAGTDSNISNKDSSRTSLENQTAQNMSAALRELMNYTSEKTETNSSSNFSDFNSLGNIDTCEINEEHLNRILYRLKMEEKSKCKNSLDDFNNSSFPSEPFVKLINKIYETNKFFTENFSYDDDKKVKKSKFIPTKVPSHNIHDTEHVNRYKHARNYASDTSEYSNQGDDFKPKALTLNKVINIMKQREKNINGDEDFDRSILINYEDDNSIDLSNTSKNSFDDLPIEELLSDTALRMKRNKLKSYSSTTADRDLLSNSHVTFRDSSTTLSEMKCKNEAINMESSYNSISFARSRTNSDSLSNKFSQKKKKKIPKKRPNI